MADSKSWLAVAVCTNRGASQVRPALEALAAQLRENEGATGIVVTSALAEAERSEHARRARELGLECVDEAERGLSAARNRVLDALGSESVIAYLDDDAVPQQGWLARVVGFWREAPDDVACMGGAVLPRFEGAPPAWMSESLYPVLSLLDLGEGTFQVESGQVWGANIGFRVGPLRDAGGFEPARGAFGNLPLFGEEYAVQRRLGDAGLQTHYCGRARVEHLIGPERLRLREIGRRRFLYGVGLSEESRPSRARALLLWLKASVGLGVAIVSRHHRLVGERTVRAAENAGVALAPLARVWLRRRHGWPGR